jgi:K+-sensing histidine kinase KdpD
MKDYEISLADRDFQSLQEMGTYLDPTSEALKFGRGENLLNLLQVMSHDIRGPLLSMVATLKLLNRGYYGKMDEGAANKIREVLSNATRLTGMAEEYLGRTFVGDEELETEENSLHRKFF